MSAHSDVPSATNRLLENHIPRHEDLMVQRTTAAGGSSGGGAVALDLRMGLQLIDPPQSDLARLRLARACAQCAGDILGGRPSVLGWPLRQCAAPGQPARPCC